MFAHVLEGLLRAGHLRIAIKPSTPITGMTYVLSHIKLMQDVLDSIMSNRAAFLATCQNSARLRVLPALVILLSQLKARLVKQNIKLLLAHPPTHDSLLKTW